MFTPMNSDKQKKTLGKRKIEIKKIDKSNYRAVTFSKRRNGLFKKVAEFCIFSGAQVGVLVQSTGGNRVYSFGDPDVDSVIERYRTQFRVPEDKDDKAPLRSPIESVMRLKQEYAVISKNLEMEVKEQKRIKSKKGKFWWDIDIENLGIEDLEKHVSALEELKKRVTIRAHELTCSEISSKSIDQSSNLTAVSAAAPPAPAASGDFELLDDGAVDNGNPTTSGDFERLDDRTVVNGNPATSGDFERLDDGAVENGTPAATNDECCFVDEDGDFSFIDNPLTVDDFGDFSFLDDPVAADDLSFLDDPVVADDFGDFSFMAADDVGDVDYLQKLGCNFDWDQDFRASPYLVSV